MAERSIDEAPSNGPTVESTRIWVTIRYFAAARAAAGVKEEQLSVPVGVSAQGVSAQGVSAQGVSRPRRSGDIPDPDRGSPPPHSTVGELLDAAADRHGPRLAGVLTRCSFLLDEFAVHGRQTPVRDGQVLDILPPFAGG